MSPTAHLAALTLTVASLSALPQTTHAQIVTPTPTPTISCFKYAESGDPSNASAVMGAPTFASKTSLPQGCGRKDGGITADTSNCSTISNLNVCINTDEINPSAGAGQPAQKCWWRDRCMNLAYKFNFPAGQTPANTPVRMGGAHRVDCAQMRADMNVSAANAGAHTTSLCGPQGPCHGTLLSMPDSHPNKAHLVSFCASCSTMPSTFELTAFECTECTTSNCNSVMVTLKSSDLAWHAAYLQKLKESSLNAKVVGGVAVIGVLIALVICCKKCCKKSGVNNPSETGGANVKDVDLGPPVGIQI